MINKIKFYFKQIWTNLLLGYYHIARDFSVKELDRFGRGAKKDFKLDNISVCQKQKIPQALADEIVKYVREIFSKKINLEVLYP